MSDHLLRCPHCGLLHDGHVSVCPTTGMRLERSPRRRRFTATARNRSHEDAMVGRIIGNEYRICGRIGQGGMSTIYVAEPLAGGRQVAIKLLHPSFADDAEAVARLRQEAQIVAAIDHPNICQIHALATADDGSPYLVMERLVGENLGERIQRLGPMQFGELAPLVVQILAALSAAHDKGILHRDLKPENVFVTRKRDGRQIAKLLDFGISKAMTMDFVESARLTHTGMVMGTPYYMAPEQARGDAELDQRVDLWAVGVIMYEALSGRRPFVASNYNALLVKILTSTPRSLRRVESDVAEPVVALVERAMNKLREDRFQTARQCYEALTEVQRACAGDDDYAPTTVYRRHEPVSRQPAATRRERVARPSGGDVDDPETVIDDEVPGAEALRRVDAAGSLRALQQLQAGRRESQTASPSFEGLIDSEPTIQDDPREVEEELAGEDTEVTHRGALQRAAVDDEVADPATKIRRKKK